MEKACGKCGTNGKPLAMHRLAKQRMGSSGMRALRSALEQVSLKDTFGFFHQNKGTPPFTRQECKDPC